MNGLRYIRTRCNLSLNELADFIGVTRQALSSWENGRKDIPENRKEQLADFFGIDKAYLGEISEEEKKYLIEKAMFRYKNNGKETYRYKPHEGLTESERIFFLNDSEISLDEEYVLARKRKNETLDKIDDIIQWSGKAGSITSQIVCINRGCLVYDMVSDLFEHMRGQEPLMKMPFFYEMVNVLKSMLIAYGLMEKDELKFIDDRSNYCYDEDGEWIIKLADQIKEHWETEKDFIVKYNEKVKRKIREEREANKDTEPERMSIEERIAKAEEDNRQFVKEHPELFNK